MKVALTAFLSLAFVMPVLAQAPVNDISVPSSQRRSDDSGSSARTYGAGYDTGAAVDNAVSQPVTSNDSTARSQASAAYAGSPADSGSLYRQFQQLQEEVAALRGQVEEQAHEIQQLKQQRQEERPASPSPAAGSISPDTPAGTAAEKPQVPAARVTSSEGRDEYEAAYAKLKTKDYDGAASGFKSLANKYPNSEYAGNSWFWLGFIYQTKGDLANSAKSFESLIERFPDHAKIDDAKFNLGKIYNQQGKAEKARTLLKEVAAGNSKSAPLAKSYLESM
ncbi:MAG TPA: tetratricopeptide repeat protein [Pseudomonadales bacterium]|nr:tetratricopeptide repeat protein [Pseudomonadales bacterium]